MEIQTTQVEDFAAQDVLDTVIENAILVGRGEFDEQELPTPQKLWEDLMKLIGVLT